MYQTGGKQDPWVITPEVMLPAGSVRRWLLFMEKYHLWNFPADMWQHMNKDQLGSMGRDVVDSPPERILQVDLDGCLQYNIRKHTGGVQ